MFEALDEALPDYRAHLHHDLGSQSAGHREAIRRDLSRALGHDHEDSDTSLTDLSAPPISETWSISISHTMELGGWVAIPKPREIGFDLELRSRVSEAVIRRMCSPAEVERVTDFAMLWSAKEALFKAMARGQPATMSQLKIATWTESGNLTWFASENGARGCVQANEKHAAAWCLR